MTVALKPAVDINVPINRLDYSISSVPSNNHNYSGSSLLSSISDKSSSLSSSPFLLSAAAAMSSLPPITPWTAALKGLGTVASIALTANAVVDLLSPVVNPSTPSQSMNSPSGGLNYPAVAQAKTASTIAKVSEAVASAPYTGESLLSILKSNGENSFQIQAAQTQVLAEQLGFLNEQFGAHLLYQDMNIAYLEQISIAVQMMASASIDSVNKSVPEPVTPIDYTSQLERIAAASDSAKIRHDFLMEPQAISDLEGNPIAYASPEQLKAMASANSSKYHSDTNNQEFEESDFPSFSGLPVIGFLGRTNVYDPSFVYPTENPFVQKIL